MNGHIRQRSPGSYELRYRAGDKTITTTFRGGKREAERELRRLLSLVDDNKHPNDPERLTIAAWLARWLDQIRTEISPRTWRQYECGVRVHVVPAIGSILLARLSSADVQAFYTGLATTALKASSRKVICLLLTNALNRACEQRLIGTNPATPLKRRLPKTEARVNMAILDRHQCGELLAQANGGELYTAILVALATGMRRSEILALRWGDIDLAKGSVLVAASIEHIAGVSRSKAPKSGKSRTVTLPATAVGQLRRIKVEQAQALFRLGVRQDVDTPICMRADGTVSTPGTLSEAFRVFIRRTGLPVVRFHDLRHSHATELLRLGVPVKVVSERLGHADAGLTLRIYAHATEAMHDDAAARLNDLFGK